MSHSIYPIIYFLQAQPVEAQSFWESVVQSNVLNILIAAVFLIWVFKRFKLSALLDQRQSQIMKSLQDAESKREAALKELREIEQRTANLKTEVEAIIKDASQTAEMVAQTILRNAEEDAQKILDSGRKRLAMEQKTASRELEQRLMVEAIHGARQLLESTLSDKDKVRSVEDFVASMPDLYQKELQD